MPDQKPDRKPDREHFEPGDDATDFTLAAFKSIVEGVKGLVKPPVVAPLEWADDSLHLAYEPGFYAKLHGAGNPYGMTELYGKTGGLWATRVRQCDACAYEVNARPRLDGKVIWLEFGAPGEYVGQWIGVGTAHPPPACPITVHLSDCDGGGPIEGATVTITNFPVIAGVTPIVGTTDASGNYTFPDSVGPRGAFYLEWDGVSAGPFSGISNTVYNCENPLMYCYRHAKLTINTTAPATLPFIAGPWTVTGSGTAEIVMEYKAIQYCSTPSFFPHDFGPDLQVAPVDATKYLNNCTTTVVDCGDEVSLSVPMFEWDTDYAVRSFCDKGCETYGEGPNFRGVIPKVLHVTPTTVVGQTLGIYEGVPITVTWDGTKWDSGCLPPPGVQCSPPYSPSYQSARMTITRITFAGVVRNHFEFAQYVRDDCVSTPRGTTPPCDDKFITYEQLDTTCNPYFASPVNIDLPATSPNGGQYNFNVLE